MLSKCVNPECSAPFQYLHDGKLFEIHSGENDLDPESRKPPLKVERYWLCSKCATTMTLAVTPDRQIKLLPLKSFRSAAAS